MKRHLLELAIGPLVVGLIIGLATIVRLLS